MASLNGLLARFRTKAYGRRPPLILLNGLAEQPETWYRNRRYWSRYFEVYAPNLILYDGEVLQHRIATKSPMSVEFLVDQLHLFVTNFVQTPPYHLVASSLGGKIAVEFAHKYPHLINRVVLLCPSGMGDTEQLPIMDGLKGGGRNMGNVVVSVFNNVRAVDRGLKRFYERAINDRKWKKGIVKTTNNTLEHTVRGRLKTLQAPTLYVTGELDKVCSPATAREAASELPNGYFVEIPACGHAPMIERYWLTNRLVAHFLSAAEPAVNPRLSHLLHLPSHPSRATS